MATERLLRYREPELLVRTINKSGHTVSTTFSDNTIDVAYSGYIPIAIIGRNTYNASGGGGVSYGHWQQMYIDEDQKVHWTVTRHSGSNATKQGLDLHILYVEDINDVVSTG